MIGSLTTKNLRLGIFGDLVIDAMGGFPKKPDVPTAPNVNPQKEQLNTAQGNLAALPTLEEIASGVDSFNLSQRNKALTAAIPGYTNLVAGESGTLGSWMRGEIPNDVIGQVERSGAAHAIEGGYGGSQMATNLTARDLGLTSLDLQGRAMSALPSYLNTVGNLAVPKQFDVTSGFLTPQQDISTQQWNELARFDQQWLNNQLKALPDPATAAIAKDVGGIADVVGTALLTWAGGIGGAAVGGAAGGAAGGALGGQMAGGSGNSPNYLGSIFGSFGGG